MEYKDGDTIYILLTKSQAESVMGEWIENNWGCDLTVHRSQKTKGRVVGETAERVFAARVCEGHQYEKIAYKRKKL